MSQTISSEILRELKRESLRYISDKNPGYFRQKVNNNFTYYDTNGERITDKAVIKRIDSLAIPPAWENAWISPFSNTHLQSTGIDQKGRKQYIYHSDWIKITQQNKFSKMIDFGSSLPKIRGSIRYHMSKEELSKEKIIATVIWLLEHTFIRIGNEQYSQENNSYGLTTLRNKHITIENNEATLHFVGKSGIKNTLSIKNPTVVRNLRKCIELPGYELFQYIDDDNNRHTIDSGDVNSFLKDLTEADFTAKDFRTWGGTKLSALNLYELGEAEDEKTVKKNINSTVKRVASHLNNTVSVCKSYYIHPTVISSYKKQVLVPHFKKYTNTLSISGLSKNESALIKLLEKYSDIPLEATSVSN